MRNIRVLLAKRPTPRIDESCFRVEDVALATPGPGEVLVRNHYLSCDPYLRLEMDSRFALGEPIRARAAGIVSASVDPAWPEGTPVWSFSDWAEYAVLPTSALHRVDTADGPLSQAIGVRGMNGLTAWVGMLEMSRPQPGDTVVVSAAVGSVGSIAGQLARLAGARVIAVTGSDRKLRHAIETFGYHAAVSHRAEAFGADLSRACPDGIDAYFDNVGGTVLGAVLPLLRPQARLAMCGTISRYDNDAVPAPDLSELMGSGATATWFSVHHHMDQLPRVAAAMGRLLAAGALTWVETFIDGIENAPSAFLQSFRGDHVGKVLVRLADA